MFKSKYQTSVDKITFNPQKIKRHKLKIHALDSKQLTPKEIIYLFFNYVLIIFWALIILFPVVSLIISAFNISNPRYVSVTPFKFGLENFTYLFNSPQSKYLQWYGNTLIIALSTMILTVIFVALNGYAYSRFKFAGSRHSLTVVMLVQMIPATASLISLYIIVTIGKKINIDPRIMLIIIYSGAAIAGNTFVFKGYLDTISPEIDDSGKIDGCNNWTLFLKLILPIAKPMLAIIALWSFLTPFGDVILPKFVIFDLSQTTLPVGLDTFITTEPKHINAGAYAAGAVIAALPPFVLFMYLQKFISGGLSDGAVKG